MAAGFGAMPKVPLVWAAIARLLSAPWFRRIFALALGVKGTPGSAGPGAPKSSARIMPAVAAPRLSGTVTVVLNAPDTSVVTVPMRQVVPAAVPVRLLL